MININHTYKFVSFIANKVQGVGYVPPDEFNDNVRIAFPNWIEEKYKLFESTQKSTDIFSEIKKTTNLTSSTGIFAIPTDYKHHDSSTSVYYYLDEDGVQKSKVTPIEILSSSQFDNRVKSEMQAPDKLFPIAHFIDGALVVAPKTIPRIRMSYLKEPLIPFWNYTVSSGVPVYAATGGSQTNPNSGVSAGNSTDISAPDYCLTEVARYILMYLGYSIKDEIIAQSFEAFKQQ